MSQVSSASALDRANQSYAAGDYRAALESADTAIREQPDSFWPRLVRAHALERLGDPVAAMTAFRQAANIGRPSNLGAIWELAVRLLEAGEVDDFHKAVRIDEAAADPVIKQWYEGRIVFLKAVSALLQGRIEDADALAIKAYDIDRSHPDLQIARLIAAQLASAECRRGAFGAYLGTILDAGTSGLIYEHLLDALPAETTFLEVGAMDGVKFDPLYAPVTKNGWRGHCLEPVAEMFARLKQNYAPYPGVTCVNLAISTSTGPATISRIDTNVIDAGILGEWALGVSSMSSAQPALRQNAQHVLTETIECATFADFCAAYRVERFDILQIDTEGFDWKVLEQIDLDRFGVRLVQIEIYLTLADRILVIDKLRSAGFKLGFNGGDIVGTRN